MNAEKLAKLQAQVRIGGKGTVRRKRKAVHKNLLTDDKKLQSTMKKMNMQTVTGIEEVNMFRDDGKIVHFNNPKTVQASISANAFSVVGNGETKEMTDLLPGILNQLGSESLATLRRLADAYSKNMGSANKNGTGDEEVPTLVEDFDAKMKEADATSA